MTEIGFVIRRASPRLLVGIDPGSNCGVATLIPGTKTLNLYQFESNIEAMFLLIELSNNWQLEVHVEDARLARKSAYFAKNSSPGKLQGVGYVKGFSKEWESFCRIRMYKYQMHPPTATKMSVELFEKITGIKTLKGESHKRDAANIILGRK